MLSEKYERLKEILRGMGRLAVSFSAGVDSTFLLKVAHDTLGDDAIAVTIRSPFVPAKEVEEASDFCKAQGIRHYIMDADVLSIDGIRDNPANRCYICKKAIFSKEIEFAKSLGFEYLAEGSNMDDLGDYRPGLQAIAELSVVSPLRAAGLYKSEIRELSKKLGLETWLKPSFACLASRIPYGEALTYEKLSMVEDAEERLKSLGLKQFRVRIHEKLARIEVLPEEFSVIFEKKDWIHSEFKKLGFSYTALDLAGYRTGSMNETLSKETIENGGDNA